LKVKDICQPSRRTTWIFPRPVLGGQEGDKRRILALDWPQIAWSVSWIRGRASRQRAWKASHPDFDSKTGTVGPLESTKYNMKVACSYFDLIQVPSVLQSLTCVQIHLPSDSHEYFRDMFQTSQASDIYSPRPHRFRECGLLHLQLWGIDRSQEEPKSYLVALFFSAQIVAPYIEAFSSDQRSREHISREARFNASHAACFSRFQSISTDIMRLYLSNFESMFDQFSRFEIVGND
jgi:hypothetical protein